MNKATLIGIGVLLVGLCTAAPAKAQYCYVLPPPQAPDACNGGYYAQNSYGAWYGPNYYVYPPYPPFNGMVPGPPNCGAGGGAGAGVGGSPAFPSHPFARGPRDFFMYEAK